MLRGFATVSFSADDVIAARDWYADLFGVDASFQRPNAEDPAYIEFRVGDDEDELGIIDRRYAPHRNGSPGGAIIYWHVDDLAAAVKDLVARGAKEHEPILERSDGSSPHRWSTHSATSWASCTTRTTWRSTPRADLITSAGQKALCLEKSGAPRGDSDDRVVLRPQQSQPSIAIGFQAEFDAALGVKHVLRKTVE
jgi:predicted enzyme related to lactoylglutathione lyase